MAKKTKKLCCLVNPFNVRKDKCKECLIRSRRSYKMFKEIAPRISTVGNALYMIWDVIDSKYGWRSKTNSGKVLQSIKLLVKDLKLDGIELEAK